MSANGKFFKGQLLLDGGNLSGSFFHHSVVLICQHDADGAFGLVLNRSLRQNGRRNDRGRPARPAQGIAAVSRRTGATCRVEFFAHGQFHSRRQRASQPDARPFARRSGGNRRIIFGGEKSQDVRRLRRLVARPAGKRNETQIVADVSRVAGTRL